MVCNLQEVDNKLARRRAHTKSAQDPSSSTSSLMHISLLGSILARKAHCQLPEDSRPPEDTGVEEIQ
jgi:hypothetical protein